MNLLIGGIIGGFIGWTFVAVLESAGLTKRDWQFWVALAYLTGAECLGALLVMAK